MAKPYRIPTASMEPTLHCAKPAAFCEGGISDRVIANRLAYRFGEPQRGRVVVFKAPEAAERCGQGDGGPSFVKRIIGLPGELRSEREGSIYTTATASSNPTSVRLGEETRTAARRALRRAITSSSATTALTPATPAHGARCPGPA